jgi:DNA-binding NarL/FixJ family response regulator
MICVVASDLFHRLGIQQVINDLDMNYVCMTPGEFQGLRINLPPPKLGIFFWDHPDINTQLSRFRKDFPECALIFVLENPEIPTALLSLGTIATGYLTRHCEANEIREAILQVTKGKHFHCPRVQLPDRWQAVVLSERELEVLTLIAKGLTTADIAEALFLSPHTVHSHRKRIFKKLNIRSASEATRYAVTHGWL